jgi:hypothetical protein
VKASRRGAPSRTHDRFLSWWGASRVPVLHSLRSLAQEPLPSVARLAVLAPNLGSRATYRLGEDGLLAAPCGLEFAIHGLLHRY